MTRKEEEEEEANVNKFLKTKRKEKKTILFLNVFDEDFLVFI